MKLSAAYTAKQKLSSYVGIGFIPHHYAIRDNTSMVFETFQFNLRILLVYGSVRH